MISGLGVMRFVVVEWHFLGTIWIVDWNRTHPGDRQETPLKKSWQGRNIIFHLSSAHFAFTENLLCVKYGRYKHKEDTSVFSIGGDKYRRQITAWWV